MKRRQLAARWNAGACCTLERRSRPYVTVDAFHVRRGVEVFAAAENMLNNRYDIGLTPNRTIAAPAFVRLGLRFDLSKR